MYQILGKMTVMGPCDIHNSNSNKKRIKCIRHTTPFLTNTPKSAKQVKTDENFSSAGRLWYTLRERPRQSHDTTRHRRRTSSRTSTHNTPFCFHFTYFLAYTGWREHAPSSQCDNLFVFSITSRIHT